MQHSPAFLALVESVLPRISEISVEEAFARLQQGHVLIDIREDHEWQAAHAVGAIHMGRGIIERDIETCFPDKAFPLMLYCGGGYRSALSADSLQQMGYRNIVSVAGGFRAWKEKGLAVT